MNDKSTKSTTSLYVTSDRVNTIQVSNPDDNIILTSDKIAEFIRWMKKPLHPKVQFAKVRPEAIIPTKRPEDAGFDIYACFPQDYILFEPHETKLVPTGIASACDANYCLILKERGSTGSKGIAQRCGVIDSGYRGEIFIPLTNTNNFPFAIAKSHVSPQTIFGETVKNGTFIYPYEKAIAQMLVVPVPDVDSVEISYDELKAISSERGDGMLGSSGK